MKAAASFSLSLLEIVPPLSGLSGNGNGSDENAGLFTARACSFADRLVRGADSSVVPLLLIGSASWSREFLTAASSMSIVLNFGLNLNADFKDQVLWDKVRKSLCDRGFAAVLAVPPVSTFKACLRGDEGSLRYGLKSISGAVKDALRAETLLWIRAAEACRLAADLGIPFVMIVDGSERSPLDLDELKSLTGAAVLQHVGDDGFIADGRGKCRTFACSKKLVLPERFESDMWRSSSFSVSLLRHLVGGLCRDRVAPARSCFAAGVAAGVEVQPRKFRRVGRWGNVLVSSESSRGSQVHDLDVRGRIRVRQPLSLRGLVDHEVSDEFLGGLRSAKDSVGKVPGHLVIGDRVAKAIENELSVIDAELFSRGSPSLSSQVFAAIVDSEYVRLDEGLVDRLRSAVGLELGCDNTTAIEEGHCSTSARGHLLHRWAVLANDPAAAVARWTWEGAPAGIDRDFKILDGLFPVAEDNPEFMPEDLATDFDGFVNYSGIEEDDDLAEQMQGYADSGFVKVFRDLRSCSEYLGGKPVLSRLGCVVKERFGKIKKRVIVDSKQSGVSRTASLGFRSVLPRVLDLVFDTLELMSDLSITENIEYFVLDFVDAFWQLPLAHAERKYFVVRFRGLYYVWLRTAQGSRGAPLSWAALAGLLMRCAMGVVGLHRECRRLRVRAPGQCYVDDPVLAVRGSPSERKSLVLRVSLCWLVLGFSLAFRKAQLSHSIVWIGFQVTKLQDRVEVVIPEAKVEDMLQLTLKLLSRNVVGIRDLRSYAGKAVNFASVIHVWRPFLDEIWAALRCSTSGSSQAGSAPVGCVWIAQVAPALLWIKAFLLGNAGSIRRCFTLSAYLRRGETVVICTDACPWGIGGWISVGGTLLEYFSDELRDEDFQFFGFAAGDAAGQQVWESLAILVALRIWKRHWQCVRARLSVKLDNMSALALVAHLKAKGAGTARIAREIALEFADAEFGPDSVSHIPGVANGLADYLSRRHQPDHEAPFPPHLRGVRQVQGGARGPGWFRSLKPP